MGLGAPPRYRQSQDLPAPKIAKVQWSPRPPGRGGHQDPPSPTCAGSMQDRAMPFGFGSPGNVYPTECSRDITASHHHHQTSSHAPPGVFGGDGAGLSTHGRSSMRTPPPTSLKRSHGSMSEGSSTGLGAVPVFSCGDSEVRRREWMRLLQEVLDRRPARADKKHPFDEQKRRDQIALLHGMLNERNLAIFSALRAATPDVLEDFEHTFPFALLTNVHSGNGKDGVTKIASLFTAILANDLQRERIDALERDRAAMARELAGLRAGRRRQRRREDTPPSSAPSSTPASPRDPRPWSPAFAAKTEAW